MAMTSLVAMTYLIGAASATAADQKLPPGYVHSPYYPGYGGYKSWVAVATETSPHVIFVNYPEKNCQGMAWNLTNIQHECFTAKFACHTYSWKGFANNKSQMWFGNFAGDSCAGESVLTRCYPTMQCINCPDGEEDCKFEGACE